MPIIFEPVPQDVHEAVQSGASLLADGEMNLRAMLDNAVEKADEHRPHRMAALYKQHLAESDPLSARVHTGWRYIGAHDGIEYSLELTPQQGPDAHQFAMINFGPYIAATHQALEAAQAHPAIAGADYRFLLLHVPHIPLLALLFIPEGEGGALAMPISPLSVAPEQQNQMLDAQAFAALVNQEAGGG